MDLSRCISPRMEDIMERTELCLNKLESTRSVLESLSYRTPWQVPLDGSEPTHIAINGVFPGADGIRLRPDGRLVITTNDDVYLVESDNDWRSARIVEKVPQVSVRVWSHTLC
jgi:hypothetical protein